MERNKNIFRTFFFRNMFLKIIFLHFILNFNIQTNPYENLSSLILIAVLFFIYYQLTKII